MKKNLEAYTYQSIGEIVDGGGNAAAHFIIKIADGMGVGSGKQI